MVPIVGKVPEVFDPQVQASDSASQTRLPSASDSVFSAHPPEGSPEVVVRQTLAYFPHILTEGPRSLIEQLLVRFPSTFTSRSLQLIPGIMACRLLGLTIVLEEILNTPLESLSSDTIKFLLGKVNVLVNDVFSLSWLVKLLRDFKKVDLPALYHRLQSSHRSQVAVSEELASLETKLVISEQEV